VNNPLAVIISDVHFNLHTLPLASASLQAAINTANKLQIPLIVAGDLNDTKAIIRAEVANALLDLFKQLKTKAYILVGDHDLINEKEKAHGLNYLASDNVIIIDKVTVLQHFSLIPYQSTNQDFINVLSYIPSQSLVIAHQGFQGAYMGEYIQDKSSVPIEAVKAYKVISGHYHRHQTLGTVTYVGTPYTITFAEANDGPKGYLILKASGEFERVFLPLRKHVILERDYTDLIKPALGINADDLLWLKVTGPYSELKRLSKDQIGKTFIGHSNFKLDLIALDEKPLQLAESKKLTNTELFDILIDNTPETDEQKSYLKELYREIITD